MASTAEREQVLVSIQPANSITRIDGKLELQSIRVRTSGKSYEVELGPRCRFTFAVPPGGTVAALTTADCSVLLPNGEPASIDATPTITLTLQGRQASLTA